MMKESNLLEVIKDLNSNLKCCPWILFLVCMLVGIILYFLNPIPENAKSLTLDSSLDITSELLGFMMASIAIFFSLGHDVIMRLRGLDNNNKKPIDVVFSTITFLCIVLIVNILMMMTCQLLSQEAMLYQMLYYASMSFTLYSLLLCAHIIFHLFTFRTFL